MMNRQIQAAKFVRRAVLGRVFEPVERSILRMRPQSGTYPIVIQGIQRSGTNFLTDRLQAADYKVLNAIDPARNDPRHKHFRWQDDKSTLRMDKRYQNDLTAQTVEEINGICGFERGMRHVVIFRSPRSWLDSIFRWGLANNWFPTQDSFFDQGFADAFVKEWDHFYAHWQNVHTRSPASVCLLAYEDLRRDPMEAIRGLDRFMGIVREDEPDLGSAPVKVRHSQPLDQKRTGLQDPRADAVSDGAVLFHWKEYFWSSET